MSIVELLEKRRSSRLEVAGGPIAHIPEAELRFIVAGASENLTTSNSDQTGSGPTSTCDGSCVCCC